MSRIVAYIVKNMDKITFMHLSLIGKLNSSQAEIKKEIKEAGRPYDWAGVNTGMHMKVQM